MTVYCSCVAFIQHAVRKPNNTSISAREYSKIEQLAELADEGSHNFAVTDDFAVLLLP